MILTFIGNGIQPSFGDRKKLAIIGNSVTHWLAPKFARRPLNAKFDILKSVNEFGTHLFSGW